LASVLLFTSTESFHDGMLRELMRSAEAVALLDEANSVLGFDACKHAWSAVYMPYISNVAGARKVFAAGVPTHAQRAILAHCDYTGLFAALCIAGVVTFREGLCLLQRLLGICSQTQAFQPVTVAKLVGLEDDEIEQLCKVAERGAGPDDFCQVTGFPCRWFHYVTGTKRTIGVFLDMCQNNPSCHVIDTWPGTLPWKTCAMANLRHDISAAVDAVLPAMKAPKHAVWTSTGTGPLQPGCSIEDVAAELKRFPHCPMFFKQTIQRIMDEEHVAEFHEVGTSVHCANGNELRHLLRAINPFAFRACHIAGFV